MRNLQEFNIFSTVKVKLNQKGIDFLREYNGDNYDIGLDENGYKEFQLWKFFNTFADCSTGFDYIVYDIENISFKLDYNTTIDVKLTDLGMCILYDLKFDGVIKNPSEVINIPMGILIRELGKYIVQGNTLPIEQYFELNTKDIPKVKKMSK